MKKLLMVAAIVAAGTAAYGNTTVPVAVSLEVTKTSNLVLMDGSTQLTQIELKHNPILFSTLAGTTSNSVAKQTFTAQTGDKTTAIGGSTATKGATITYTLEGIGASNSLPLTNGETNLASTLVLSSTTEEVGAGATAGTANTITSTILASALQGLANESTKIEGNYSGTAQLKVTAVAKTTPGSF